MKPLRARINGINGIEETAIMNDDMAEIMNTRQYSLRDLVEKWLAPTPTTPIRVTRFSRTRDGNRRYVCVESARPACSVAIVFFRHDDGAWRVFPPRSELPAMTYPQAA